MADAEAPFPWDVDVAVPLEICFSPTCVYHAKFGHSGSDRTSVMMDLSENFNRSHHLVISSDLSRSLKVIGTDADRSASCDFLLVFLSNYSY